MDARYLVAPALRGMDRYLLGLVAALSRRGVEITLMYREREPIHTRHLAGIRCHTHALADYSVVYWEQVSVPHALWRGDFDVWHAPAERGVPFLAPCPRVMTLHSATHASYADLVARGLLSGRVADYFGPAASEARGWHDRYYSAQARWAADHVLTVSKFSREEIIRLLHVPADRVTVTPLAVSDVFCGAPRRSDERAATLARLAVRRPFLLYVGGYEPHKNVHGLLELFAAVRKHRPDLSLVMVGTGAVPDGLFRRARALGLVQDRDVRFLVSLTDELVELYDECELFVSLSWRESFGLPALEAMSRGARVVASGWGAAPEVIGGCGRFVDPRDPRAAATVVLEVLEQSNGCREKVSICARQRADQFSWEQTAAGTLEVYRKLLQRRRAR